MKQKGKYWLWIVMAGVLAAAGFFVYRHEWRALTITGAVTIQDADFRKQLPIADAEVFVLNGLTAAPVRSNSSGFFSIRLFKKVRRGQPITLQFRHPGYQPLDLKDFAADKLYIAQMVPIRVAPKGASNKPIAIVGNVRVRYSIKALRSMNVGSAVKTFVIENKANVPCENGPICSPDGKWRAAIGSVSLDAGLGNEFHNGRLSCISGPCPFTRVESDNFSTGGQTITASVRNWSDSTMYLLEAEVAHSMVSEIDHQSYPVIFGPTLSFTLPAEAEGVSLEGDLGGETIIFPLGPNLLLSWADCTVGTHPDQTKIYRCELKPGYQFQP